MRSFKLVPKGQGYGLRKHLKDQGVASKSILLWLESIRHFLIISSKYKKYRVVRRAVSRSPRPKFTRTPSIRVALERTSPVPVGGYRQRRSRRIHRMQARATFPLRERGRAGPPATNVRCHLHRTRRTTWWGSLPRCRRGGLHSRCCGLRRRFSGRLIHRQRLPPDDDFDVSGQGDEQPYHEQNNDYPHAVRRASDRPSCCGCYGHGDNLPFCFVSNPQ